MSPVRHGRDDDGVSDDDDGKGVGIQKGGLVIVVVGRWIGVGSEATHLTWLSVIESAWALSWFTWAFISFILARYF